MTEVQQTNRRRFQRVVVAIDSSGRDQAVVEAGFTLAQRLQANLHALYVEDIDALNAMEYPAAGVYSTLSAARNQIDMVVVEQAFRAQVSSTRQVFEQVSRRRRFQAHFEVRRGRVATEVLAIGADADLIVINRSCGSVIPGGAARRARPSTVAMAVVEQSNQSVLLLCTEANMDGPVFVVYDGSEAADTAVAAAAEIANEDGGRIVIAVPSRQNPEFYQQCNAVVERLQASEFTVALVDIGRGETTRISEVASRAKASVVVIDTAQPLLAALDLGQLLSQVDSSILLIR